MAVYKRDIVDINLETGNIHRSFLKHSIGYKDQKADHFGIRTYRDGVPVDLTGVSVQGIFLPPQGDPIAITSGNIVDGNVAEVVLPQACYNYDGQFTLSIKLVDSNNSVTGTMRIVDGMVDNTHASGTVAPTSAVPTYQEILSTYDEMVAATAAANGCIASTYSSSSTYKVGDYCIHDGGLYRCTTAITTAEAWTSGHWTAAKIGPDVSDLKSAMDDITGNQSLPITGHGAYIDLTSQSPGIDNPVTSATAKYIVAPCAAGDQFVVSTVGGSLARAYGFFGSNKTTLISSSAVNLTCVNTLVTAPANAAYFVANAVTDSDLRVIKNKLLVDKVSDLVSERQYNSYNILPAFGQFTSRTHNNITFTWQPDKIKCNVSSTNAASDTAYTTIYYSQTVLPAELIPGKSYYFEIERTDSNIAECS